MSRASWAATTAPAPAGSSSVGRAADHAWLRQCVHLQEVDPFLMTDHGQFLVPERHLHCCLHGDRFCDLLVLPTARSRLVVSIVLRACLRWRCILGAAVLKAFSPIPGSRNSSRIHSTTSWLSASCVTAQPLNQVLPQRRRVGPRLWNISVLSGCCRLFMASAVKWCSFGYPHDQCSSGEVGSLSLL